MKKNLTKERKNMLSMHENGMTYSDIARAYGCTAQTVAYHIAKASNSSPSKGGLVSKTLDIPPKKEEKEEKEARMLFVGNERVFGSLSIKDTFYVMCSAQQVAKIRVNDEEIEIPFAKLEALISDLTVLTEHTAEFERAVYMESW